MTQFTNKSFLRTIKVVSTNIYLLLFIVGMIFRPDIFTVEVRCVIIGGVISNITTMINYYFPSNEIEKK
jgi:hypothetical protein